ncbi:SpoIIE family protein phosphatase [Actinoplanes sp. NPDC024001]|uniref:SpoIIE family protein phosphatase n=1 Tax=Actinoplanes sp. NPDC024001 TaxID=3154598 RepID=UPI0033F35AD7
MSANTSVHTGASAPSASPAAAVAHLPLWQVLGLVTVAYGAGASLAFLGLGAPSIVVLFLPAGVTLSALILNPRERWPWILAAVALTEIAVDVLHGMPLRWVGGFALANTAEPLVGALLLRRYVTGPVDLLRRRDVVAFLGCCAGAGPLAGALIGATTLAVGLGLPWVPSFVSFWAGDAAGVLTVAGCVLAWRYQPRRHLSWTRGVLSVGAAAAATIVGFWPDGVPLFYLPIPVLFGLAFSQPLVLTLTAGLATTVAANLMTSTGHGPWAALDTSGQMRTLTLQLFLTTTILGAWALAVEAAERDRARRDTSVERAARLRLNALQILTSDLAKAATTEAIARVVVREGVVLLADHGSVAVVAPDDREIVMWTTPAPSDLIEPYRRIPLDTVTPHTDTIRGGRPVIIPTQDAFVAAYPHLAHAYRTLGIHSSVFVPIRAEDSAPLGALAFSFGREHGADADVVAFAETLASLTGQALRRAQAYERERDAAHQLQQALLPVLTGEHAGVRVGAAYRPADLAHQVGGDWYDVFPLPGGRIGLAVGDVVGHQVTAAAAMSRLQSVLRILAQSGQGPAAVLDDLDRASALIPDAAMTTVGFADYDPATRTLRYACAGHLPPLLVTEGGAAYLWEGRSMPIGIGQTGRRYGEKTLPDSAALVWFTDGLVERRKQHIADGMRQVADAAVSHRQADAEQLCRRLLDDMVGDETLGDDTAVLCVQFTTAEETPRVARVDPAQIRNS